MKVNCWVNYEHLSWLSPQTHFWEESGAHYDENRNICVLPSFFSKLLRAMIWDINLRNVVPGDGYGGHFIKSELSEVLTSQDNLAQCLPGGSPCPDNKET